MSWREILQDIERNKRDIISDALLGLVALVGVIAGWAIVCGLLDAVKDMTI